MKISVFAVSPSAFDDFASTTTLSELLQLYLTCEPPADRIPLPLYISETENLQIRYVARPSGGLFYFNGGRVKILPRFMLAQIPFLNMTIKDYLRERESSSLKWVLECLASVNAFDWLRWVISYQRHWWIGSLLEAVEPHLTETEGAYDYIAWLFQKMLRGSNSGKVLPAAEFRHVDFHFPVLPITDDDSPLGVWQAEEVQYMAQLLEWVVSMTADGNLTFKAPPAWSGISPADTEEEWHTWVNERVNELQTATSVLADFPDLSMISFIE
jgi:hypothetical protein